MSDVRTFRAKTMREALDLVERDLGREAIILQTRQISGRRLLPWRRPREEVEITAGVGLAVRTLDAAHADPGELSPARPAESFSRPSAEPNTELAERLSSLEAQVAGLGQPASGYQPSIPSELFDLYTELIDSEVDENLARELVFGLKRTATPDELSDPVRARAVLAATVESEISCGSLIQTESGRRKVVALVGPTGVGKTTTIAKLAANFRLRDGIRMGLVTVDTYRIAAVEQLRTYAEIIELPMKVVTTPLEMRRALDEFSGLDLVLVDTAGRSPRDELQISELKSLLGEADIDEVHLVLSLTASLPNLVSIAERFAGVNTTAMILTKLDEAAELGTLLNVTRRVNLPISYLTTGQDVPDDIEPAEASRIARLVLGQDRLFE